MRFKLTIRGENAELRGYFDGSIEDLIELSNLVKPLGIAIASPTTADYNPFKEAEMRELHHFETEMELERMRKGEKGRRTRKERA